MVGTFKLNVEIVGANPPFVAALIALFCANHELTLIVVWVNCVSYTSDPTFALIGKHTPV